jgi:hypothetical protein
MKSAKITLQITIPNYFHSDTIVQSSLKVGIQLSRNHALSSESGSCLLKLKQRRTHV